MYPFWVYWSSPFLGLLSDLFLVVYGLFDMSSEVVTLKVRVSPEFREKITNTAKENNRSMNQEIVSRLEQSFTAPDPSKFVKEEDLTMAMRIKLLTAKLDEMGLGMVIIGKEMLKEKHGIGQELAQSDVSESLGAE